LGPNHKLNLAIQQTLYINTIFITVTHLNFIQIIINDEIFQYFLVFSIVMWNR
jgi:hypothetical protein